MKWWSEKDFRALNDIARLDGYGWRTFLELLWLRRTNIVPPLYALVVSNILWDAIPMPPPAMGQWLAMKVEDGSIQTVYHLQNTTPMEAQKYQKDHT